MKLKNSGPLPSDFHAHLALGRLDSMANLIPNTSLFHYMYVRKEAVLSSITTVTVNESLTHFVDLGILNEATSQTRSRVFAYTEYITILGHGTNIG